METNFLLREDTFFKIEQFKRKDSIELFDVKLSFFQNGNLVTTQSYDKISLKEKNDIVVDCLETMMIRFDIEREVTKQERRRLATKLATMDVINGYIIHKKQVDAFEVELLINGESYAHTSVMKNMTEEKLQKMQRKLDEIIKNNIDIRKQYHQLRLLEILSLIE